MAPARRPPGLERDPLKERPGRASNHWAADEAAHQPDSVAHRDSYAP
jgi:hypothetical protein